MNEKKNSKTNRIKKQKDLKDVPEHVYDRFKKLAFRIYLFYKKSEEDYKKAIKISEKILKFDENNIHALMLKGFVNFRLKNRREAFEIYERVEKLFAENTNIQDNFTQLLIREWGISYKDIIIEQKFIDNTENKLRSKQIEDSLYEELAISYNFTKNFTEAIKYYRMWLEKERNDYESWYYLGEICEEIEDFENALNCFENASKIDPADDKWLGIKEGAKNKINDLKRKLKKKK